MTAPRRRWSFGLRTLFVGVTVLAVAAAWVRHEWSIGKERAAKLTEIRRLYDHHISTAGRPQDELSFVRRLAGDENITHIEFDSLPSSSEIAELKRLFPSARINSRR